MPDSFHSLLTTVEETIGPIKGIGELTIYDTALKVGAALGFEPDRVHLHSGTREGAKQLRRTGDGLTYKWATHRLNGKDFGRGSETISCAFMRMTSSD